MIFALSVPVGLLFCVFSVFVAPAVGVLFSCLLACPGFSVCPSFCVGVVPSFDLVVCGESVLELSGGMCIGLGVECVFELGGEFGISREFWFELGREFLVLSLFCVLWSGDCSGCLFPPDFRHGNSSRLLYLYVLLLLFVPLVLVRVGLLDVMCLYESLFMLCHAPCHDLSTQFLS